VCIHGAVRPQSFTELQHRPHLVDLTVEEGQRLKVIYGSSVGFHVIDVDSGNPYDIYIPSHVCVRVRACVRVCVRVCVCVCVFFYIIRTCYFNIYVLNET